MTTSCDGDKTSDLGDYLPTRASLLERLKDLGDQTSWMEFYQAYHELIYSTARRAGLTEHEADEALQTTLISVARKMPGFTYDPAKDSFKGWLLTVTRWRVRDQFQKRSTMRRNHTSGPLVAHVNEEDRTDTVERVADPVNSDLELIWDQEWEKHLLQTALNRTKRLVHPRQYEIYHLHVILGKPVPEVKQALQVNSAQVYLAKHRVGACLKRQLKCVQNGFAVPPR